MNMGWMLDSMDRVDPADRTFSNHKYHLMDDNILTVFYDI